MKRTGKRFLSALLTIVLLLGMLPTVALAAPPSGTITAYLYYKVNGQVPADRNNKVQYNDTTQSNYGPSGDNTPMLAVEIDVDKLLEIADQPNSPVEFADPSGRYPEWYFRPVSADDADVHAFWDAVQKCMTKESQDALAATGMGENFVCYLLKRNGYDTHGYYVHMDGILNVNTEDDTDVYVCELYDENNVYIGGHVTDSTKDASEDPTLEEVYDVYEAHFGMPADTVWTRTSNSASAQYTDKDGNRYRVTVSQTNLGRASHKPHDTSEVSYEKEDDNYYLALFGMTRVAIPYTVTYTDGLSDRVAFKDEVFTGLYYGVPTPGFTGGTPEDPLHKLIFTGWTPSVSSTVTGDTTYTAQWEEEKYTVTWLDDDGTELEVDENVADGTTPSYNGATPTKASNAEYSYEFIGWTPAITPVDSADQIYTAVYRPVLNTYTVKWQNDDGTELEVDEDVAYGTLPTYDNAKGLGTTANLAAAKNTQQYTYRFAGWSPVVDFVTGDITYKATYTYTTNTYTVTWIDYNGNVLDTDTVAYGTQPAYTEAEPTRVPTAQYTYEFAGWKNTDGTDTIYASNGNFPAVTENVTYEAQYTSVLRSYTVTLKLYLDNVLVNSAAVHGTEISPYIKADKNSTLYASERTATGTYVVKNVPNGVYGIYNAAGKSLCEQIIVVENADVEKACHYYTVSYEGNGADSGVPEKKAYHLGKAVTVEGNPQRIGYTFKGWKIQGESTVLQPNKSLTASIAKTYVLEALWEKTVNVTVNVTINHAYGSGYDILETKDDVFLKLVRRANSTSSYLEIGAPLTLEKSNHSGFIYSEVSNVTTYTATEPTFTNMPGGDTQYTVVTSKSGYYTTVTPTQNADGNWVIDVEMTYNPTDFNLNFTLTVDSNVPEQYIPTAAIVKIAYWDVDEGRWNIITQQRDNNPGVRVNIDKISRSGSGSYPVWKYESTSGNPYGYRIQVASFIYPNGTIVPAAQVAQDVQWSDAVYTATAGSVADGKAYGTLNGAYFDDTTNAQKGTLDAVITMDLHSVTFDAKGGKVNGQDKQLVENLYKVPAFKDYVPTRDGGYIFLGWYADSDCAIPAEEGKDLTTNITLYAKWEAPLTISGDIEVAGTYQLSGETKIIQDADRIQRVTVLLQYAPAGSTTFTTKQTKTVDIVYTNDLGSGSYLFTGVPNDGGTWRVHVLNHNYTTTYQNEIATAFAPESDSLTGPSIAVDNNANRIAEVDVKMIFDPVTFELFYKVIADDIGASQRPQNAEVLVLYDATTESESPRLWPVISQMQDGTGYTGNTGAIGTELSSIVWISHPLGHLYDYAIKVEAVDGKDLSGNEPYTIEYNGSAEYTTSGGYKNQTQLLTATLKPKAFPVKYYLELGSSVQLHTMANGAPIEVSSHIWSFDTQLKDGANWKDVPSRSGWVFTGWVDAEGNTVTSIDAKVQAETKLYATWAEDNWKDVPGGKDSPTGGDGIADSQQVRIVYTTDGHGTTAPLGEIVTISGDAYTDKIVTGDGSTATALTGYAYDGWIFMGSSDKNDNATAALDITGTKLVPTIQNADGGKTYTFKVSFAEDKVTDPDKDPDPTVPGDGICDKYQAVVEFHSANTSHGNVSGEIYQVITFAGNATSGTVTPVLDHVTVTALPGWAFDYWVKDQETTKLQAAQVEQAIANVAGGTVIRFYANFAIDEWKDDPNGDSSTGGDGTPDHHQILVTYIPAANGRGTVEGKNAVQVFTLPDGTETMNITPAKNNLTVTANSGYAFDYWGDLKGFWGAAGAKLTDEQPFQLHNNVPGGSIITYVAHFDTDNWNKDGSETGGDGIPDAEQVLIRYTSNDTAKGTVSPAVEVITLTAGEKKGPEDISSDKMHGATATALTDNAFDYWYSSRSNVTFTASAKTIDPAISGARGGEIYTFTAAFGADTVGDEDGSDDVPDVYQKPVQFKVVNGNWNDGTDTDLTVYVTLTKDGKWSLDGSGTLPTPAVGQKPDSGYKAGDWDVTPPTTVDDINTAVYTYTYKSAPTPSVPVVPGIGSVTLAKIDSADAQTKLSGVIFDLYKADGTWEGAYTTGADGTITVNNLPAGEHYWVEVRPAEGYMLDASKHTFTVSGDMNTKISISNTRTPVPEVFSGDHYAYIIGYSDGLVHPEANITRAEVATIFFRLLDDATRARYMTTENSFADVNSGMWFNTAVSTMAAMGIVNGYPDGNFHPNANITRAEFAAIAARFDSNGNTTGVSFRDIYGHWAQKEINLAYNNGWMIGYEGGFFKPNQNIIRAEAMTMINRVLQRVPESKNDLLENMIVWPDNKDTSKWYYLAVQEATNSHDYGRKTNGYEYWSQLKEPRDWTALER